MSRLPRLSNRLLGVSGPLLGSLFGLSACAEPDSQEFEIGGSTYSLAKSIQLKLPKALREISGLALDQQDRLYAHDDERAVVYQIDYHEGRILQRFVLDDGQKGDFEGIALVDDNLFLIESNGVLYRSRIGADHPSAEASDNTSPPLERVSPPIDCEVEGLTYQPSEHKLLIACKNLLKKNKAVGITIYSWLIEEQAYDQAATLTVSRARLGAFLKDNGYQGKIKLQPTGIALAGNGNLILIAAPQRLLLELTAEGEPVSVVALDRSRHRQAEGIAVTRDNQLLIADEGDSKGSNKTRGRLTIYEPAR